MRSRELERALRQKVDRARSSTVRGEIGENVTLSVGTTRAARQKHGWKGVSASAVASRAFWRRSERASEWVGESE